MVARLPSKSCARSKKITYSYRSASPSDGQVFCSLSPPKSRPVWSFIRYLLVPSIGMPRLITRSIEVDLLQLPSVSSTYYLDELHFLYWNSSGYGCLNLRYRGRLAG